MPPKKKNTWIPFNLFESENNSDDLLTSSSISSRTASNPTSSTHPSLHLDERRVVSEYQPRKPLNAAELQKLHEDQEREAREERKRAEEASKVEPPPVLLKRSDFPLPHWPTPLRVATNCLPAVTFASTSAAAIVKPPAEENDVAVAKQDTYFDDRLDSAGPLSNENFSFGTQCSSSSPDRDSGVVTSGTTTAGDDMASAPVRVSGRPNRFVENRPPMSTILCRNGPQCRKLQEGKIHL